MQTDDSTQSKHQTYLEEREKYIASSRFSHSQISNNEYTQAEIAANKKFTDSIRPTFSEFPEDFFHTLAMKYKKEIEVHPFFQQLLKLPKGALLHHHFTCGINPDLIIKITYDSRVFEVMGEAFGFKYVYLTYGEKHDKGINISKERLRVINEGLMTEDQFNDSIRAKMKFTPEENAKCQNNREMWQFFIPKIYYTLQLIGFKEFYRQHLMNCFEEAVEDKTYRFETRLSLGNVTDEEGTSIPIEEEMQVYLDCLREIRKKAPDFTFGIIIEMYRNWEDEKIQKTIEEAYSMKAKYRDLIVGIDLVGNEDHFRKYKDLSKNLLNTQELKTRYGVELPFVLHAGESIKKSNENLIDGMLLKAKRFGHAINLFKHSYLLEEVKKEGICIEVNPVSNQTLKLIRDLRVHPAIGYHSYGIKIVIGNDDPTLYNTKGCSYDLFVAVAAFEFDLFDLKRVCLNSIECSLATADEKERMRALFAQDWSAFIESF